MLQQNFNFNDSEGINIYKPSMMRTGEGTTAEEKDKIFQDRKQMKSNLTWTRESRMCTESQLSCAREPQKPWRIEELAFSEDRGETRQRMGELG